MTLFPISDLKIIDSETLRKSLGQVLQAGKKIFVQLPNINFNIAFFQRQQQIALAAGRTGAFSLYFTPNNIDQADRYLKIAPCVWLINDTDVLNELKGAIISVYSTAWLTDLEQLKRLARHNVIAYEYIDLIDEAISGDKVGTLFQMKQLCFSGLADVVVASAQKVGEYFREEIWK